MGERVAETNSLFLVKGNRVAVGSMVSKPAAPSPASPLYKYGLGCSTAVFALAIVAGCEVVALGRRFAAALHKSSSGPQLAPAPAPKPVRNTRTLVMPASAATVSYSR